MANSTFDEKIRARIQLFTEELTELIRQSALENLRVALANPESGGRGRRRGAPVIVAEPGRRGRNGAAVRGGRGASRAKGAKRDPAEIAKLTDRLSQYVKEHPGQRIEQIASGIGVPTKELTLPAKKLIAAKQLKTKGQKRATQYFGR
jgi:hypothetical protein